LPRLEDLTNQHDQVGESCVIAAEYPELGERPVVVIEPAQVVEAVDLDVTLKAHLAPAVADVTIQEWWIPDRIIVDILLTARGKFNKKVLRNEYRDVLL